MSDNESTFKLFNRITKQNMPNPAGKKPKSKSNLWLKKIEQEIERERQEIERERQEENKFKEENNISDGQWKRAKELWAFNVANPYCCLENSTCSKTFPLRIHLRSHIDSHKKNRTYTGKSYKKQTEIMELCRLIARQYWKCTSQETFDNNAPIVKAVLYFNKRR